VISIATAINNKVKVVKDRGRPNNHGRVSRWPASICHAHLSSVKWADFHELPYVKKSSTKTYKVITRLMEIIN